jgi:type IV secretory pathway protease TraF
MTRFGYFLVTNVAAQLAALLVFFNPAPRLVWNATESAPIGFYTVSPGRQPGVGDLALVSPPPMLAGWLARRHYLPLGVPLIKHVAAAGGQQVCRSGATITIDRKVVAQALPRDRAGRTLPVWTGCRRLAVGEVLLLNPAARDSMDGRYFRQTARTDIIGTVRPVWTRAAPDAPFRWQIGRR